MLHLLEHVTRRDDEDTVAPATAHELGQNHADLQGLAQAHGVSQEDARAQVRRIQGLANRRQLVGQRVSEDVTDHGQVSGGRRERRLAQRRLQPQAREPVTSGGVRDDPSAARIHRDNVVKTSGELRRRVPNQLGQALHRYQHAVRCGGDLGDQPVLVAHPDHGARSDIKRGGGEGGGRIRSRILGSRGRRCHGSDFRTPAQVVETNSGQ